MRKDEEYRFIYPLRVSTLMELMTKAQERLLMAADNKIIVGEDENGYIYEKTSKEETKAEIEHICEQLRYELININASAKALEQIAETYRKELDKTPKEMMMAYMGLVENFKVEMYNDIDDEDEYLSAGERAKRAGFSIVKPQDS